MILDCTAESLSCARTTGLANASRTSRHAIDCIAWLLPTAPVAYGNALQYRALAVAAPRSIAWRCRHFGNVPLPGPATGALGMVDGKIGGFVDFLPRRATFREKRHPNTWTRSQPVFVERDGLGDRFQNPPANGIDTGLFTGLGQQNNEFVSTNSRNYITLPYRPQQSLAGFDEGGVSGVVAEVVVDRFEVIEINQEDGKPFPFPPGCGRAEGKALLQQAPIGQPGQRIVKCCFLQLALNGAQFLRA